MQSESEKSLTTLELFYVIIDLETTGFIQGGIIPNIVQLSAKSLTTDDFFTRYVTPKVPVTPEAEKVTGIKWTGENLLVNNDIVDCIEWRYAIADFFEWLKQFDNVILVAHNGRVFDFNVLCHCVNAVGLEHSMRQIVLACIDSVQLMRKTCLGLKKYSLSALVDHFLHQEFNAHNAIDDVEALVSVLKAANVSRVDYDMFMYPLDVHFMKNTEPNNATSSLQPLVDLYVLPEVTARSLVASGITFDRLQCIAKRLGKQGLSHIFKTKSKGKSRIDCEWDIIDDVIHNINEYFYGAS